MPVLPMLRLCARRPLLARAFSSASVRSAPLLINGEFVTSAGDVAMPVHDAAVEHPLLRPVLHGRLQLARRHAALALALLRSQISGS